MRASPKKVAADQTTLMVDFESYPFSAGRFFTDLRTFGAAPSVCRRGAETYYSFSVVDPKLTQRFFELCAWAHAHDKDDSTRSSHLRAIVATKPDGDFIHYLG